MLASLEIKVKKNPASFQRFLFLERMLCTVNGQGMIKEMQFNILQKELNDLDQFFGFSSASTFKMEESEEVRRFQKKFSKNGNSEFKEKIKKTVAKIA